MLGIPFLNFFLYYSAKSQLDYYNAEPLAHEI